MTNKLKIGASPHIRNNLNTRVIMIDFLIGLFPIFLVGFFIYKGEFIFKMLFSLGVSLALDILFTRFFKLPKEDQGISSAITAVLLALSLPINIPLWILFFGIFFALLIGKFIFGGMGQNLFNPALIGRVFLMFSFPQYVFHYKVLDGLSGATSLQLLKYQKDLFESTVVYKDFIFGINKYNSLGEISFLALLFGFLYLSLRKRVNFRYPLIMMTIVFCGGLIFDKNPIYYLFSGGVVFGAIYFLTDPVSSPHTHGAKKAYAIFVGILVVIIREFTQHPEGLAYAILIGNAFAPLFNKLFKPRVFGRGREMKEFYSLLKIVAFSVLCILLLNFFDKKYSAKIEVQKENMLLKEMKRLVPVAEKFDMYEESLYYEGFLFIPAYIGEKKIAYIVKGQSRGYSEKDMEFLLALDLKGVTLGHKIINHQETLGLGSKISEKEYEDLWKGKDINSKFIKEIDSASGATYTFLNFYKTIKEVLKIYNARIINTGEKNNNSDKAEGEISVEVNKIEQEELVVEELTVTTPPALSTEGAVELDSYSGASETVVE